MAACSASVSTCKTAPAHCSRSPRSWPASAPTSSKPCTTALTTASASAKPSSTSRLKRAAPPTSPPSAMPCAKPDSASNAFNNQQDPAHRRPHLGSSSQQRPKIAVLSACKHPCANPQPERSSCLIPAFATACNSPTSKSQCPTPSAFSSACPASASTMLRSASPAQTTSSAN